MQDEPKMIEFTVPNQVLIIMNGGHVRTILVLPDSARIFSFPLSVLIPTIIPRIREMEKYLKWDKIRVLLHQDVLPDHHKK